MCWCIKLACPLLLNLSARISSDIIDQVCKVIMCQYSVFSDQNEPNKKDIQTITVAEPEIVDKKPPIAKKPALSKPVCHQPSIPDSPKPFESLQKWNESLRNNAKKKREAKADMADRPLPVPVENEFYYMEIGRKEAESLLEGQPDGTFILRPSSQTNHVYTVTLMYQGKIYNIGCRKRHDGHLALGFSKTAEPHFLTIHDLIEYYYNEKLIIITDGKKVGSTVLKRLHP